MLQIPMEQVDTGTTIECDRAHSCLSGEQECMCEVEQLLDDSILSVKPPPGLKCIHKMRYQEAFLCTCPVRKEIYKRYRI